LFLDFIDEPKESERWTNPAGIYKSYMFGKSNRRVKVILLDTRFNLDDNDILGETQWKWFQNELVKKDDALFTLIASSVQVIPKDKILAIKIGWGEYEESRKRFFDLLVASKRKGIILLSGDVHFSTLLWTTCTDLGYPLFEFTSSGLTHSIGKTFPGITSSIFVDILQKTDFKFKDFQYIFKNFGILDFDWENKPSPKISLKSYNQNSTLIFEHSITADELSPNQRNFEKLSRHCEAENRVLLFPLTKKSIIISVCLSAILFLAVVFIIIYRVCFKIGQKTKENKKEKEGKIGNVKKEKKWKRKKKIIEIFNFLRKFLTFYYYKMK